MTNDKEGGIIQKNNRGGAVYGRKQKNEQKFWNETDSQAQAGTWYCVEGSCQHLRQILKDNKFMGGILVDQFYDNPGKLSETIEMNLRRSDGLMVFDIVHIIQKNLWKNSTRYVRQVLSPYRSSVTGH